MTATITIAVPTYERLDLLDRALDSIRSQTVGEIDVVVVDNASPHDVAGFVKHRFPTVRVVRSPENHFFAGAANLGLTSAQSPFVAVLNDDAFLHPTWAEQVLASFDASPEIGSVASKVLDAESPWLINSAGDHLDVRGRATNIGWGEPDGPDYAFAQDVFSVSGSCAVYRRTAFRAAGQFDAAFVAYLEDVDLGFRLQLLGFRCVYNPAAVASHHGGSTSKPRHRALRLTERNMVWNIVKNMPTALLRRYGTSMLAAQGRPAPIVGGSSWTAWSHGKATAWTAPRALLEQRRRIQAARRVSDDQIERLLLMRHAQTCHL